MFGKLRFRIDTLEGRVHGLLFGANLQRDSIEELEGQIEELTKALEWHVGASLEIMLAEGKLINLRVAEAKERGDTNVGAVAEKTYEGVEQSVEQKLNNDVRSDTDKRQER